MVLLEIVSGKRNFEISQDTNNKKFSHWAYEEVEKGNAMNIGDTRLSGEFEWEEAMRGILVSFLCIQKEPTQRPMMGKVVQMREGVVSIS